MRQKIKVDYGFIILMCLLYLFDRQSLFGWTMLAAAVHECGHILVVFLTGNRIEQIRFTIFGACINLSESHRISYANEAMIATGGPMLGVLCAFLFAKKIPLFSGLNLCLSIFNLLPIPQLDGGKILGGFLSCWFPVDTVDRALKWLGIGIGLSLAIAVLVLSGSIHCTVGMILFSAFLIRMCF